jgi:hypothetical protein
MKNFPTLSIHVSRFGAGGAHVRPDGRPTFCMAPEDSGGGSGAASTSGAAGNATSGTQPTGGDATERTFKQDEVNRIAAQAREEGRKSASKDAVTKTTSAPATDESPLTMKQLSQQLADERLARTFDKKTAKLDLDEETSGELFELYKGKPESERDKWLEKRAKVYAGRGIDTSTTNANSQQSKTGESNASKANDMSSTISDKGAAGAAAVDVDAKLKERPRELSASEITTLQEKHGVEKANDMIKDSVLASLKNVKLVADPRRKAF